MGASVYVGTSGWSYPDWKADFFAGVPRKDWLRHYAQRFRAVEVNATFYGRVQPGTFEHWKEETPADFRFVIKGHRYLTHVSRLLFPPDALARQRDAAMILADRLAAVLWQMPRSLKLDLPRLESFAAALKGWPQVRHALEFRDASWFCPEAADCLGRHGLAACQSDSAGWPLWDAVTTDLVYVRLHGHEKTYRSAYTEAQLRHWAYWIDGWLKQDRQVHVYFDNTDAGHAPKDAARLLAMLGPGSG
jgi:uncharacterized protein YecE (DUF72 family)